MELQFHPGPTRIFVKLVHLVSFITKKIEGDIRIHTAHSIFLFTLHTQYLYSHCTLNINSYKLVPGTTVTEF
jgi:hypothetical protein